jgi:autotransporter-associated beta strand protein
MKTKTCLKFAVLALACAFAVPPANAVATGFNQTAAGPYDYNTAANWVGTTINGIWDTSLTLAAAQTVTFAADTTLTTGLTFNYAGNYALTLDSSSTTAHTLTLGGDISLNTSGGSSANVTLGNAGNPLNISLGASRNITVTPAANTLTIANVISGAYGITKAGSGTLALSTNNTYTGGTTINAGTVKMGVKNSVGTAGTVTVNSAGTLDLGGKALPTGLAVTLAGGTITTSGGAGTLENTVTMSGGGSIGGSGSTYLNWTAGNITAGTGDLTIPGPVWCSGGRSVTTTGNIIVNTTTAFQPDAGTFQCNTVVINGKLQPYGTTMSAITGSGSLILTAGGLTINQNQNSTFSGIISGASGAGWTKSGSYALTLTGANTYNGTTTLSAGQLNINYGGSSSANSAIGTGTLTISGGTTIDNTSAGDVTLLPNNAQNWNGDFTYAGSVPNNLNLGTGAVTMNASRQVTVTAGNLTVGGIISGSGFGLTKAGSGTLTLNNAEAYTGGTTVTAGILALGSSGSLASTSIAVNGNYDVSLVSGGYHLTTGKTLSGTGTVTGPMTVDSGATLTVGGSTGTTMGTLTVNGGLTLAGTTTLRLNKGGGTTSDLITKSSGTITLGGTLTLASVGTTLADGDQFTILAANTGSFSSISPTAPGTGLAWDTSLLNSSGIIKVVSSAATVTATGSPLTALTTTYGTPSSEASFTVSGANLLAGITVTPPAGYEVSTTSGSGYTGGGVAITVGSAPTVSSATVYVRLAANTPVSGTYNAQNIGLSSSGATATVATASTGNGVTAKNLTISSATAQNKMYDGTTTATVTGSLQTAEAFGSGNSSDGMPYIGDSVTVTCPGSTFASSAVGAGISVTAGTFTLGGSAAGNYTVTQPTGLSLTASIINAAVWTNLAGGSWPTNSNWSGNIAGTGSGNTADFSTLTLGSAPTVTLDGARTIGNLIFGDVGNAYGWILTNGTGGPLTLDAGTNTPDILVSNQTTTISATLAGTNGLTKTGNGTLVLSAANTYTGGTTINAGIVKMGNNNALGTNGTVTVNSAGTLDLGGKTTPTTLAVTLASGTITSSAGSGSLNSSVTLSGGGSIGGSGTNYMNWQGGSITGTGDLTITGPIWAGGGARSITNTGNIIINTMAAGVYFQPDTATLQCNEVVINGVLNPFGTTMSAITGSGSVNLSSSGNMLTVNQNTNSTFAGIISGVGSWTKTGMYALTLTGVNTYTGNTTISAGTLALGATGSISNTPSISLAAGATFDVSAISAFALTSSNSLSAAGTTNAANITGASGGTISLDSRPIILTYDGTHPALTISQGALLLNGNAFTVNSASPLALGSYIIVSASSAITSAGTYSVTGTALPAGKLATISVSSNNVVLGIGVTTVNLTSSENPSGYNDSVTFTAAVQTNGATAGNATGYVLFETNSVVISSNNISSGGSVSSAAISTLPRGTNVITAVYSGDANYLTSTAALNQVVTNHPPTGILTVTWTKGLHGHIAWADVTNSWSDADGDGVAMTGFNLVTTNGANLTTNSYGIYYTNNLTANDQINYTITDSYGETNTGYIYLVASNSVTGTNSIANINVGGSTNAVTAYGIPGYSYILERATNLAPAIWVDVVTNTAATNGVINATDNFNDLGNVAPGSAYYRLKWQP